LQQIHRQIKLMEPRP